MGTLIYKRTHKGDPYREGRFGIHGCMGWVRTWPFDAVIGVGGIGAEPRKNRLDGKVNWIGIGPHKMGAVDQRGFPVVTFDHFRLFGSDGSDGPSFVELAPQLAARMLYSGNVRVFMNELNPVEQREVKKILARARNHPASSADGAGSATGSEGRVPRTPSAKPIKDCST